MPKKHIKFGVAIGVVLVTLSWLAYSGVRESKTYYVTVKELQGMGDDALGNGLRGPEERPAGAPPPAGPHRHVGLGHGGHRQPADLNPDRPVPHRLRSGA